MDIQIENHGSIVQLVGITVAGKAFMVEHLDSEGWQWMGNRLCIEPRLVAGLVEFATQFGINIQ